MHEVVFRRILPGVELTARGRIVHLGVLFSQEIPEELPAPGTPLIELVRWARAIPGSLVVLVHPLPLLWRYQLRRLARAGALPDAIETRFPLVGWRSERLEQAARVAEEKRLEEQAREAARRQKEAQRRSKKGRPRAIVANRGRAS